MRPETCIKGARFYVAVLASIRFGRARTDAALLRKFKCNRRTIADLTPRLAACGLIHPAGWELSGTHWMPVWGIGDKPHAPHPLGKTVRKLPARPEVLAFARLWNELQAPTSTAQLVEVSGFNRTTVSHVIKHARDLRMARIAGWLPHNGQGFRTPLFALGGAADEPRPAARPMAELQREYAARVVARRQTNLLYAAITGRSLELAGVPA